MIRTAVTILCVVCIATVLSEVLGLGLLWSRGQLDREALKEIHLVLSGETDGSLQVTEEAEPAHPSVDDVSQRRAMSVLALETRNKELELLKAMVTEKRTRLNEAQQKLSAQRDAFQTQLKQIKDQTTSAAAEQARGILLALPSADAVASLMTLSLDENVMLLGGMQEKAAAKILQEFGRSEDPEQIERGQKIFEAISQGQPKNKFVGETLSSIAGSPDS